MTTSSGNNGSNGSERADARSFEVKVGLAEMLKGGVIMDVTTPEQAKVAEDAGAAAVMALERVPADIRRDGGVARMAAIDIIVGIQQTVSIPVMAKARIGHFMEARVLEAADYIGVDRLGTTDDCGFSPFGDDISTARDTAFAKIRARVAGTASAAAKLGL